MALDVLEGEMMALGGPRIFDRYESETVMQTPMVITTVFNLVNHNIIFFQIIKRICLYSLPKNDC